MDIYVDLKSFYSRRRIKRNEEYFIIEKKDWKIYTIGLSVTRASSNYQLKIEKAYPGQAFQLSLLDEEFEDYDEINNIIIISFKSFKKLKIFLRNFFDYHTEFEERPEKEIYFD